ncbi:MAG: hypothetical protein R3A48_22030 [Polyangiales bacterium]
MRALLKTATSYQPVDAEKDEAAKASREQSLAERDAALRVLRVWCEEWSTIARQLIRRKDWLIALGLASRKRPKKPAPVV